MEHDRVAWLCAELGLPALAESDLGVVANAAAQTAGCVDRPLSLERALAELLGCGELPLEVREAIMLARHGQAGARHVALGAVVQRVLVVPQAVGHVQVLVAPETLSTGGEIARRASLVDVAAAVSHEVANAVGAIAGWAELAAQPDSEVSSEQALQLIGRCARTAQEAARSLLSLARGDEPDEAQELDFSELAEELLHLLSVTAKQARVRLSHSVPAGLTVLGSRAQLFTVLWNLTKNAIEACAPGAQVEVVLALSDGQVAFDVRDTGAGLTADELARIFTPYYSTKTSGTGLGLALVQQTVADLGGQLTVQSAKGRGTTFRVVLPRATRPSKVVSAPAPKSESGPPRSGDGGELRARILVVDDDDALREMVATALTLRGAEVVAAKSSEEAKRANGAFDIALIDMMLDECRGDELLTALRRRGLVSAAMLVTGTVQKPRLVPGGEPDDWVRKPFELGHLVDRIRRTLERHRMLSAVTAQGMR